jgi:hypothetical protein
MYMPSDPVEVNNSGVAYFDNNVGIITSVTSTNSPSNDLLRTCDEVLQGAMSAPTKVDRYSNGREWIKQTLTPNFGLSLAEACQACGIDHFNYRNKYHLPTAWEATLRTNGVDTTVKEAGKAVGYKFLDPVPDAHSTMYVKDPRTGYGPEPVVPSTPPDSNESYYNDHNRQTYLFMKYPLHGNKLEFWDAPSIPSPKLEYRPGEYQQFFTELVGVDSNGKIIKTFRNIQNAAFFWSSNQVNDGAGGHLHMHIESDEGYRVRNSVNASSERAAAA